GGPGCVLVAVLEQHVALGVDQQDNGDPGHVGHRSRTRQTPYSLATNRRPRSASSTRPTSRRTPSSRADSRCHVSTAASTTAPSATSRRPPRASLSPWLTAA